MLRQLRLVATLLLAALLQPAFASTNGLVISQVYGGGGNSGATYRSDFIEVFNAGSSPVSLSGYTVQYASATGTTWAATALQAIQLQPGQYYLIQEADGANTSATPLPTPDSTGTTALSATAGKVALVSSTTLLTGSNPSGGNLVDLVGFGSTASGFEGTGPTAGPGNPTAVVRASNGCTDSNDNKADFTVVAPTPRNTQSTRNQCGVIVNAPIVTTCPSFVVVAGTSGSSIASATDADGTVNGVLLNSPPAGIGLGTLTPAAGSGGTATVPIVVSATVAAGTYPLSLTWTNDQSQSATCTPTVTVRQVPELTIPQIQGSGTTSPYKDQTVVTQGVVTRVVNNGFYMQALQGDGDPNTSDGIFVFTSTAPTVAAGNLARVLATVSEFNTGAATNADTASHTITELSSVSSVTVIGSGYTIVPVTIAFPFASRDELEKYEHMLVTINGPLTVVQNYFLGMYGQATLAAQGRTETPTNRYRPGPSALALDADNKRRSIILEDGLSTTNPSPTPFIGEGNTLRDGDTATSITGIIDYGLQTASNADAGSWRIIPTVAPVFTRANPRQTAPDDVGGNVRIASANVLNFFTTFTNGQNADGLTGQGCALGSSTSASNCRGADNVTEFIRQRTKIVEELAAINADAVGLMEIQNNQGVAVGNLVAALNAKLGAGTYAAVPDPVQGTGTDAIKVAMIYKPGTLTRSGESVSDPDPIHNRPPLAQTFIAPGGQTFTLVVNHLKSKGCSGATGNDADLGDLQGCFNASRVMQAQRTRAFIASLFPAGPLPPVLLIGDFNSYAQEDPIIDFTNNGYVDEIGRFNTFGYSYNFDSASGRLDQAITSPTLSAKVVRAIEWHVNSDEPEQIDYNLEDKQSATCTTCPPDLYTPTPYRASDHDPVVIGITFTPPVAPPPRRR